MYSNNVIGNLAMMCCILFGLNLSTNMAATAAALKSKSHVTIPGHIEPYPLHINSKNVSDLEITHYYIA